MPEEKSVLTADAIGLILESEYHITASDIMPLGHGSANCRRVTSKQGVFFLKEYQSRFKEEDLLTETGLVGFLLQKGFPTAEIMPTAGGKQYFEHKNRYFVLQKWIDGKTYTDNGLPRHLLTEAAGLLGKLHYILRDYPLPLDMGAEWINSFSPEKASAQYDNLLSALESQRGDALYSRIRSDLIFKKQLANEIAGYGSYFDNITYCATHGDYTCFQFVCDDEHIKAVIDFSSARKLPAVWEIMRSYVQSSDSCKDGKAFKTDEFCGYVGQYMKYSPLTDADLTAMPFVYLYQLARSRYGYREYLISKTENRDSLIRFAFWRTDICREIGKNVHGISEQLRLLHK